MRKSIMFSVFATASFLLMIVYCMVYGYTTAQLEFTFYAGDKYVMLLWWLPYILIFSAGIFSACAVFTVGNDRKETMTIAVLSLAVGIGIAVFTVLAVKMVIKLPFLGGGRTAINWSSSSAKPSMVLAGVFTANSIRHFLRLGKYKEQEISGN